MKEFELSIGILKNVFDEEVTFQNALKTKFKNNVSLKECRPLVAALTGCVLRHNILLDLLIKDFSELTVEERYSIYLAIANEFFVKRINSEDLQGILKEKLSEDNLAILNKILEHKDNPDSFIPESISKNSLEYLSIRFNTPEWVLKIWRHFGASITFKMLRKNLKPVTNYVRVRTSMVNVDDVLVDPSFNKTFVDGILEYKSRDPLRKNGFFKRDEIFLEKPVLKSVLDKFVLKSDNSEIFIYNGNSFDTASLEILETYGTRIGINIGCYSTEKHLEIAKYLNKTHQTNVNFFAANPDSMMANISNVQDLVVVYPESTNFDLIRENPDYLLHFKKEHMSEILNQQTEQLNGCSKFVADQGYLLYIVPTVSIKECRGQVVQFLKANNDFKLIEEKQLFPFDEGNGCLYYAYLKRGMDEAKLGVPPSNGLSTESITSSVSQAGPNNRQ